MSRNVRGGRRIGKPGESESRVNLLQKIKFYEDELGRLDLERSRLLQQLDKVCEEKDEQIKELKTTLYEKQVEADHQLTLFSEEKKALNDEIAQISDTMDTHLLRGKSDVNKLREQKDLLEAQLLELHDYMVHKDITMERIKELEDKLAEERISYETQIKKLQDKVESERNNIRREITREVQSITSNLEASCLQKLSLDSKLALEKFSQVNQKLEEAKKEMERMSKDRATLRETLHTKKMRLEIAESLLSEMLKQLQRKFNARKDFGAQVNARPREIA